MLRYVRFVRSYKILQNEEKVLAKTRDRVYNETKSVAIYFFKDMR